MTRRLFLAVLSLLILGSCAHPEPHSSVVRIGYLPIAAELPLFVAVEKGYFADEHLTVRMTRVSSSNDLVTAATAKQIDVLAGAAANVVFDAADTSGQRQKLFVINPYSDRPTHVTDHLIVASQSGIHTVSGLRGHTVAGLPGSVRILIFLVFERFGVNRTEYRYVELPPKDWEPALKSNSIQAVVALEPTATQILRDNVGLSILPGFYAKLMPDLPLSGHWFSSDFVAHADARTLDSIDHIYRRAIDFCRSHPAEAKQLLPKYAGVRADILTDVNLNPWQNAVEIDSRRFQQYADLLSANKAIRTSVQASDFVYSAK